ncbi:crossover junction endodeoxyribonuclease RuvC [Pelotomaculum propionicicum]|uniref:Crossover junction endodeoxyribonuclease RuvC n=1 Tax=Pelotomaculum propionicicum TaxID=258475 RepID=A0A4Y7RJB0_9FIRM|nr:crossover junction endodeoxyribonuclease RuvC [Pelotomaculum propionicicum]NLI14154.1 crossover junction endodeoxyribonuclease RuvC [Peptococcaceae bacterium]TEB08809.1 Crossover junction endodeoxyribonuclease RuvC [Pelotomaculum propionicicum]
MLIMGVDPGTAITGFGLVKYNGSRFTLVDCGCIRTSPDTPLSGRLHFLYRELVDIISRHNPEQFAVEELFFNKNAKTALAVGHARGVAMLAAASSGLPVFEYTPLQVKQSVAGFGRAEKTQVQFMVKTILALPAVPAPDDVADALAVAICHGHLNSWVRKLK